MASLAEIRQQYPQYSDLDDNTLADALYKKFYSDMPRDQFNAKLGISAAPSEPQGPAEFQGPPQQPMSGAVLPFSTDETGKTSFDPNAGIIGALKRAVMAPGEVWQGKLNPFSEEGQARATETAMLASPTSVASRAGERVIPGVSMRQRVTPKAPSTAALKGTAEAQYKKVADLGVDYSAGAVKNWADDAARTLNEEGFIAELGPKTHAILRKLQEPPEGSVASLKSIEAFRRQLGRIAGSPDATEAAAASAVIRKLDDFLAQPTPGAVVAGGAPQTTLPAIPGQSAGTGDAAAAAQILRDARGNRAAAFRSQELTDVAKATDLRAAAANSGRNSGNTLRSRLASLLLDESRTRGFTQEELAAIEQVVKGTASTNTLRYVSNLLGAGGGLGQSFMAALGAAPGAVTGNVPMAMLGAGLPTAVGAGARSVGNRLTAKQLAEINALTRMRSPMYQNMLANAPHAAPPELSLTLLRALIAAQGQPGGLPPLLPPTGAGQ